MRRDYRTPSCWLEQRRTSATRSMPYRVRVILWTVCLAYLEGSAKGLVLAPRLAYR